MEAPLHQNTTLQDLIQYVKQEADDLVKMVLENQSNIKTQKNMTSLAKAAVEAGSKGIIITLLQHGFNVNAALDIVVNSGKKDLIELMLNQGADANEGLYFAIKANKTDAITFLLELGANINTNKRNGNTPLHTALMQKTCNIQLVEFLIKKGADTGVKTQNNKSPLDLFHKFLDGKHDAETMKKLENVGQLLSDNQNHKIFECIMGLSDGLSGYSYQTKIFTLYVIINTKQAISYSCQYELSTEVKNLVPFDDIYLRKTQEGQTTCEFIQIKQTKKPEFNKINPSKFFSILNPDCKVKEYIKGNDSVVKIFLKFDEIQESLLKHNTSGVYIHCENSSFQDDPSSCFIRVDSVRNYGFVCGIKHDQWIVNKNILFLEIIYILLNVLITSQYFSIIDNKIKTIFGNQIQILDSLKNYNMYKTLNDVTLTSAQTIAMEGLNAIKKYLIYLGNCKREIENAVDTENVYNNLPAKFELLYTDDVDLLINRAVSKINEVSKSFTIDKGLFSYFSKFDDIIIRKKIDNFVNHFSIYTDCPTTDDLDKIITKQISEEIKWDIPEHITAYCLQYFNRWVINFKNGEGKVFTDKHGMTLFNDIKLRIFNSYNKFYIEELLSTELYYRLNNEQVAQFLNKDNNYKMLHVITECPRLHAIHIFQTIKNIKEQSANLDHLNNIMNTSLEHVLKSDENLKYIFDVLSSQYSNDLLILECLEDSEYNKFSKIFHYFKNLANTNARNKIIIISKTENKLSEDLKIIIKEHTSHNETISFQDLTYESQQCILKKTVNFHNNPNSLGTRMKLENFINISSAFEVIDEWLLSKIIINRSDIQIGNEKPFCSSEYNAQTYIPRYLLNMDIRILKKSKRILLFVTGITKNELITKISVDEQYIYTWEKDKVYNKGIVLMPHSNIATSEEIFKCLTNNFHLQNHQEDYWELGYHKCCIWLEFRGHLLYMKRKYFSEGYKNILESIYQKHKISIKNLKDKVIIIANDAGEGKTTMLTHLAYCMRKKSKKSWIIRIDLRYYADNNLTVSLNDIKFCVNDTTNAIELLSRMVQAQTTNKNNTLERKLLEAVLKGSSKMEVILLLDGFDEISPGFKEKTCNFIKTLSKSNIKQLWVTTRVHLKQYLEKELGVQAWILASFDESEQEKFMCKIWKWQLNNYYKQNKRTPEECTLKIVNQLKILLNNLKVPLTKYYYDKELKKVENLTFINIQKFINNQLDLERLSIVSLKLWKMSQKTKDFFKIPLHIEMFAKNFIQRNWNFSIIQNSLLFGMYTEFVKSKLEIYYLRSMTRTGNQYANDQADMAQNLFKKMHHEIAVTTLYSSLQALPDLNVCNEYTNFLEKLTRVGLVKFYGSRVEFVHRTFAEYFFSEYLATHLDHPYVQTEFLEKILLHDEYQLVRIFFNEFLLLQCQKQEITSDIKSYENILTPKVTKKLISHFRNNENVLHIAVRGGHFQLFLLIFKNIKKNSYLKLLVKNSHEGYSMLQLSIDFGHPAITNIIVDSIKDTTIYSKIPIRKTSETVKEQTIMNKNNIKRSLFADLIMKCNKNGQSVLHMAAEKEQTCVCKNIINAAKACSILGKLILCSDSNKSNVLHYAARKNAEIVQIIIESVEVNSNIFKELIVLLDNIGNNVLHLAAMHGNVDACGIILSYVEKFEGILKYLLTQRNSHDKTALHYSITWDKIELIKLILEKAQKFQLLKDIFIENNTNENSILNYAAWKRNEPLCALILNTVKDHEDIINYLITQKDLNGRTALHHATNEEQPGICDIILKTVKNCKQDLKTVIMLRDNHENTALKTAVWSNDYVSVHIILSYIVKYEDIFRDVIMQSFDEYEWTVLHLAASREFSKICSIILNMAKTHQNVLKDLIMKCDRRGYSALEVAYYTFRKTLIDLISMNEYTISELIQHKNTEELVEVFISNILQSHCALRIWIFRIKSKVKVIHVHSHFSKKRCKDVINPLGGLITHLHLNLYDVILNRRNKIYNFISIVNDFNQKLKPKGPNWYNLDS